MCTWALEERGEDKVSLYSLVKKALAFLCISKPILFAYTGFVKARY
jgi:hypothetical protein